MSRFATGAVNRILKNNVGMYGGKPRIYNMDTHKYTLGYTQVNTNATSPFSRTKVHKCWLSGTTDIRNGHLIKDMGDDSVYLVMSMKAEIYGQERAYWDGTLYNCNLTCSIQRYSEEKATNLFGRVVDSAPETIASGVYIMLNPLNYDEQPAKDTLIENDKIKMAIQSKYGLKLKDRILTSEGDTLVVETLDKYSLSGIWIAGVDKDSR